MLTHVGCVLTLKGDSVRSQEPVVLRNKDKQIGEGPSSLSWPKCLPGFGMCTCRLGIYSAEHSGFGQASLLLCGLLLLWTEFLQSPQSALWAYGP